MLVAAVEWATNFVYDLVFFKQMKEDEAADDCRNVVQLVLIIRYVIGACQQSLAVVASFTCYLRYRIIRDSGADMRLQSRLAKAPD